MKIPITVTRFHIESSVPRSASLSPLVFAIQEAIPGCIASALYGDHLIAVELREGPAEKLKLPREATELAQRFDQRLPVQPLTFELSLPESFVRARDWPPA